MSKHHNARGEQRNNISKRLSRVEAEVREMRKPMERPEDVVARQAQKGEKAYFLRVTRGNADYGEPVKRDMERLHGRSTSGTMPDDRRGSASPLGRGEEVAPRHRRR
jgi:hypothetical protein